MVADAIEIGARVLDREQAGANAEFVKTEFEKVSKSVEAEFGDRARAVAEQLGEKVDAVFHPDTGHLSKSLDELFSDGSSTAVQHRVKELVAEALQRSHADLRKQFASTDEGVNPLADFKARTVDAIREADERQDKSQRALLAQMHELEIAASGPARREAEARGAGRRARARHRQGPQLRGGGGRGDRPRGRRCRATRATPWATSRAPAARRATWWWEWMAARGPPRGRIVFEAKDRRLSKPQFLEELDAARDQRDADFAVLVVPGEDEVPARLHALREYQGDKMIAVFDPEDGSVAGAGVRLPRGPRARHRPARGRRRDRRRGRALHGRSSRLGDGRRPQDQVPAHHRAERDRRARGRWSRRSR